jgi:ATP-dependent helicase/nuclease subunit A
MTEPLKPSLPPDQFERQRALDPARSILVQAPAGSGKTDLLTRRFLRLLAEVEEPGQVVAITFTIAAAAEMRHRILSELEKAAASTASAADEFSMDALAHRALLHSQALGWKLLDLPAQLRISTIDSFCRELAVQQPLLSGFGGGLEIAPQPEELYRRAARETLRKIDQTGSELGAAIERLLLWRDNNWQEMEALLVEMLASRDRWMHGFLLEREPDWEALRARLERPFAKAVGAALTGLSQLFDQAPGAREEALALARFACEEPGARSPRELAECVEISSAPFAEGLESARDVFSLLSGFLQTQKGSWRSKLGLKTSDGFPSTPRGQAGKTRFSSLIASLAAIPCLETALAQVRALPPARYTEDDWEIVKACFTLLRQAAGELKIAFAEAGAVDFIEIAQIAQRVLQGDDGLPTDAALAVSDGIRHLLVDEFQDTSRRQHQLLASLIAAWPERTGRTGFVVGDPMQSIYFFRDADAELFPRVKTLGLEIPHDEPLLFDFAPLKANFRTAPELVEQLNQDFEQIFAEDDGSGVRFASAQPERKETANAGPAFTLHLDFVPQAGRGKFADPEAVRETEAAHTAQINEMVALVRGYQDSIDQARANGGKFRIALLGRAKKHLVPITAALREAKIAFRAVELEELAARPEVLDALALARALLNPEDRVAWLGVLRAPWCGLSLEDLHTLTGSAERLARPVPELLAERLPLLSEAGQPAATRVLQAMAAAAALRAARPTATLGSWLEQVWLRLGGAACVDENARANLDLLWSCLDRLPDGEPDLLGPSMNAALKKLTALPDPKASSDCGVQLMTIHKAKGLEFEVVIVPELQAANGRGQRKMLSWMERGLTEPDASGEITEFLIAPFQRKGEEKGSAKAWVDRVYRERESQENRRILYVAATRAREELHLFARPACKAEGENFSLIEPAHSLLATAWPALAEETRARFEEWKGRQSYCKAPTRGRDRIRSPPPAKAICLSCLLPSGPRCCAACRRIISLCWPKPFAGRRKISRNRSRNRSGPTLHPPRRRLARPRAGRGCPCAARRAGPAAQNLDWEAARSALSRFESRIAAQVRAVGVNPAQAAQLARRRFSWRSPPHLIRPARGFFRHTPMRPAKPDGPELSLAACASCALDRVFTAGATPELRGRRLLVDRRLQDCPRRWSLTPPAALRPLFAPQIEAYAQILRNVHGAETCASSPASIIRACRCSIGGSL